ncbi:molybdopterin-guanine dinucleotide biosynthesis protein B [Helicobacter sp. MIT 99-5507]|uniref:molybdopterin-guanine dinucleotide biosynthesis protein B n=1 Tax=Helicobacter sp. MIT 99-5507 TaxID=152489 RepID=UPI000E1EC650|nr:molybdopterin-guanine dinucleotide biosynthesis protein B [Helicobacter sp. MIT 99-5507]RDU57827.1 molybdopterin-guanine dinucleotide biosynthesis protein B [Helicobacter sp. MIT 99-5507]
MTKIISFSGISNSGKTTLIENLCKILIPTYQVGVIKHDPKNKAIFDKEGKDSYKFFQSGANVAIVSPKQTNIRFNNNLDNNEIINILNTNKMLDYIFIEGFKTMPYKKICVIRGDFVQSDLDLCDAIATTKQYKNNFKNKIVLDLDNYKEILQWINNE